MSRYLQNKEIFGKYRVVAEYDQSTNDFPRNENGLIDDSFDDLYIKCAYGNRISYYGKGKKRGQHILEAYIPSLQRGRNIIRKLDEQNKKDILFDIKETDSEVVAKFYVKDLDTVAELLKAKLNRVNQYGEYNFISPFSKKNLPKSNYKIPENDLIKYKQALEKLPKEKIYLIKQWNKEFISLNICHKKLTINDVKADQKNMMLKEKDYIHYKGFWDKYVEFVDKKVCNL
jgi:hypothetical protein